MERLNPVTLVVGILGGCAALAGFGYLAYLFVTVVFLGAGTDSFG
jgi:hypothetical protein